ncbi:MAG: sensor hybrid histidine kinase [Actinomycetia bacterium]|nr:sensor hybrid histidine kinase [Actinomycetes bacterium]
MQPAEVEHGDVAAASAAMAAHRELVGELAEHLSHDLANRLAVARLTAEVLANRPDLPDDLAERVATVVRATSEAGDLVQHLSAVAGRRPSPPHRLDLSRLVTDLGGLLRAGLGRRALELVVGPAVIVADRRDVEEVVLRLVLGGERGGPDETIALSVTTDDDDVVMVVRRPSAVPSGALARVAELVPIEVTALPDGGQELTVRYPALVEERLEVVAVPAPVGVCVLVVEDDADLRGLVCDALRADGHTVEGVADASRALAHPMVTEGRVELLVTDVELPGMSGLELAEQLLAAGVRVMVISGHGEAALGDELPEGALILDKPFGVPDLRTRAREALL